MTGKRKTIMTERILSLCESDSKRNKRSFKRDQLTSCKLCRVVAFYIKFINVRVSEVYQFLQYAREKKSRDKSENRKFIGSELFRSQRQD